MRVKQEIASHLGGYLLRDSHLYFLIAEVGANAPDFRYWEKGDPSKLKLAEDMLTNLAKSMITNDIWVTFDSWYFVHSLCQTVEGLNWN